MALQTVVHLWSQVSFLCHTKKVCRTIRSHQDDCPGAYFPRILYISHQSHNHSSLSVSVVAHSGIWDPEYLRKHVLSSSSSRFLPPAALCSTVASPGGWLCSERSSCVLQRRLSPWRHVPDAAEASRGSFLSCPRAADWCKHTWRRALVWGGRCDFTSLSLTAPRTAEFDFLFGVHLFWNRADRLSHQREQWPDGWQLNGGELGFFPQCNAAWLIRKLRHWTRWFALRCTAANHHRITLPSAVDRIPYRFKLQIYPAGRCPQCY